MSNPYGYSNSNNQGGGEAASYYASANQSQQQSYNNNGQQQQQQQRQDGPTGERGVLGAIGGAVAGGVGGHQLGGKATGHSKTSAIAGHKIQDGVEDWKDNRDEEKKKKEEEEKRKEQEAEQKKRDEENKKRSEEQRKRDEEKRRKEEDERRKNQGAQQQQQQQQQQSRDSGVRYAGGFSGSCKDISLDQAGGEYVLRASCRGKDGSYRSSSIALNGILSNDKGCFHWAAPGGSCAPPPPPSNNCGGGQYTVVAGDSLHAIGERYKVDWRELARHNNIANPDLIFPGQVLNIPGRGGNNNNNNASNNSGGGNFGASARNVRLEDCGKKLVAELRRDGQYVQASIILDERIGNENGCLVYKN